MFRHKKSKARPEIRIVQSTETPPAPKALDTRIAASQGRTVEVDATQTDKKATKAMITPSLVHIIEQKTWENGRLRQELAYEQKKNGASKYLMEEIGLVVKSLEQARNNFQWLIANSESELSEEK
jgi:hypothetical protein